MRLKHILLICLCWLVVSSTAKANEVGIFENLGGMIPQSLEFKDEGGNSVTLKKYFDGTRPVILVLAYYGCPSLCTLVFNGLLEGLDTLEDTAGKDFRVVAVSIDPTETPGLAQNKKEAYLSHYKRPGADWTFLTGDAPEIQKLAESVGFKFYFDTDSKEYVHASGIFLVSPEGRVERVLQGVKYASNLKLALVEAGAKSVWVDRIFLKLYNYSPDERRYIVSMAAIFAVALLPVLVLFIVWLSIKRLGSKK